MSPDPTPSAGGWPWPRRRGRRPSGSPRAGRRAAGGADGRPALLVGRDGSAVSLDGGGETVVPAGEYRLASTTVVVRDLGGSRWSYVFSDAHRRGEPAWHPVAWDGRAAIDPIGDLDLRTGLDPD